MNENVRMRQEAIDRTGQQSISIAENIQKQLKQVARRDQLAVGLAIVLLIFLLNTFFSSMKKWGKQLSRVERSIGTKTE